FFSHLSLLLTIFLLSISITFAESSGQIHGQVRDESGQAVRGAAVRLSSRDGRQLSTVTGEDGVFAFRSLLAGDSFVKAEAAGFRAVVSEELKLGAGENRELEMVLRVN